MLETKEHVVVVDDVMLLLVVVYNLSCGLNKAFEDVWSVLRFWKADPIY